MDLGRTIYRFARLYAVGLFAGVAAVAVWIANPELSASLRQTGLWFALAGFTVLVFGLFVLVQWSRQ